MVHFMGDAKALVIVEGEKAEPSLLNRFQALFPIDITVCPLGTNIYSLFRKMKDYDFNADVRQVILEIKPLLREKLSEKYAYTYLLFDLDPHHTGKIDSRSPLEIALDNIEKVREMAEYFTNETDPTVGRLYINYPMFESIRDCDLPFDESYRDAYVEIGVTGEFKQIVASRRRTKIAIKAYTMEEFRLLTKMNLYKLNLLSYGEWASMSYDRYLNCSMSATILERQSDLIQREQRLSVLHTSLFMLLDYFGNRNGFYDGIIK